MADGNEPMASGQDGSVPAEINGLDQFEEALDIIEAQLTVARRATPGPWFHHVDGPDDYKGCGMVFTLGEDVVGGEIAAPAGDLYPRGGYDPYGDMAFIAANNPHIVVQRLERDLRLLQRHQLCWCRGMPDVHCATHLCGQWPCIEVVEVVRGYGVEINDPV